MLYLMAQVKSSELWRQVKAPVLALYGSKDLNVPAAKNVAALTEELTAAANPDFTVRVFPAANHDGFEVTDPMLDGEQLRYVKRLVPGLIETQMTWVLAHVKAAGKTS
jgi:uncharacterized protein